MKEYLHKTPVWAFCGFMFQIGGVLTMNNSTLTVLPVIILLVLITLDDVVLRMICIATGKAKNYKTVVAPISFFILIVYQRLVRMNIGFVSSDIFLISLCAILLLVFFLALFPIYYFKSIQEK